MNKALIRKMLCWLILGLSFPGINHICTSGANYPHASLANQHSQAKDLERNSRRHNECAGEVRA